MLSKYFQTVTNTDYFKKSCEDIIEELKGKKVLLYGAGEGYLELEKKYKFREKLNIIGISDLKFASKDRKVIKENKKLFKDIKMVEPSDIPNEEFDTILVTNEYARPIIRYLVNLELGEEVIKPLFVQEIIDESINLTYLYRHKFDKTLPKLIKKLKGKKVLLYGAGAYLETIKKYFDISGLNIIGISDRRFAYNKEETEFLGYKTYSPEEIVELKPDYVVVSTKFYINIVESLYENTLKNTNIKIKPLVSKSFWTLFKEAMN